MTRTGPSDASSTKVNVIRERCGHGGADESAPFPDSVFAFFEKRYGLSALVQQHCADALAVTTEGLVLTTPGMGAYLL